MRARVTDFDRAPASNSSQGLLLILSRCDNHPEAGRFELASYVVEPATSRVDVFARHKKHRGPGERTKASRATV